MREQHTRESVPHTRTVSISMIRSENWGWGCTPTIYTYIEFIIFFAAAAFEYYFRNEAKSICVRALRARLQILCFCERFVRRNGYLQNL